MMYRVHFETKGAYWAVQVSGFMGIYWKTAMKREHGDGPQYTLVPLEFQTFDDAMSYVEAIGLHKAYHDVMSGSVYQSERPVRRTFIAEAQR